MKVRSIHTVVLLLLCGVTLMAQSYREQLQVSDIELQHTDKEISVKFTLQAGEKSVKSDYNLIILPTLTNHADSIVMPEIIIQGNRAAIAEERDALATGKKRINHPFYTRNGGRVSYMATMPYQSWMHKSQLVLNGISAGCCSAKEVAIGIIADGVFAEESSVTAESENTSPKQALTTGEKLSEQFAFLAPLKEDDEADLNYFINNNREGSLTVYFVQGSRVIDRSYKNNHEALLKLISVIRAINASNDSRVARIIIAGFASPEGTLSFNEQLAWDRGAALRRFVTDNTTLSPNQINIYNGTIDWSGLRKLVMNSDLYEKYQLLEIIDTPDRNRNDRLNKLMKLNKGESYRYMLNNFFPLLRNAAYVKVYYENL